MVVFMERQNSLHLGVNPPRLLWRFLKDISCGHEGRVGGGQETTFFSCLGPQPSYWSEAGCVWFQHRRCMYTTKCKVRTVFSKGIFVIIGGFLITLFIFAYLYHVIFLFCFFVKFLFFFSFFFKAFVAGSLFQMKSAPFYFYFFRPMFCCLEAFNKTGHLDVCF